MIIRSVTNQDKENWLRMRDSLWPSSSATNLKDIEECFVVVEQGNSVGFIEINIRNYAEGSSDPKVPYIEGWYIDEEFRGQGLGKKLMEKAESWAKLKGFTELASDAEIDNSTSIHAHKRLGFKETDRIVCFLKKIN